MVAKPADTTSSFRLLVFAPVRTMGRVCASAAPDAIVIAWTRLQFLESAPCESCLRRRASLARVEILEATRHPYRSRPVAHLPEVSARTRKLAARGATIVLICVVCRWIALLFSPLLAALVEALLVVGTWLFTLRCDADNRAARTLGGALRVVATIDGALAISGFLDLTSWGAEESHFFFALLVTPAVGLLYLAARLHSFGVSQQARKLITLMGVGVGSILLTFAALLVYMPLTVIFAIVSAAMYCFSLIWGYALMFGVRRVLRVEVQEWWLDVGALPSVQWISYAHLGDGRIELVGATGGTCWFDDYSAAMFWLKESGFCSEEQAVKQGLVDRTPAPLLAHPY